MRSCHNATCDDFLTGHNPTVVFFHELMSRYYERLLSLFFNDTNHNAAILMLDRSMRVAFTLRSSQRQGPHLRAGGNDKGSNA